MLLIKLSVIVTILLVSSSAHGAQVKIKINLPDNYERMRRQNAYAGTACNDIVSVDRASLQLPGMLSMLDQRVRFYRSQIATQNIVSFIGSATVPGLSANTVADVLQALRNGGCPVFIYGGVVRDQFLERTPNDVDTEVDCSISTVVTICKTQWGEQNCGRDTDVITHIGTPSDPNNVDLAPTGKTFYAPLSDLEYTANSLAYDTNGNDVIIDLPGNGVDDVCARKIRIPSDDNSEGSWDAWRRAQNGTKKLYRFWKLRAKGFTAFSDATENYIVQHSKEIIDSDNPTGQGFKQFYCSTIFGSSYSSTRNSCPATEEVCTAKAGKAATYNMVLTQDFSNDYITTLTLPTCGKCCRL